MAQIITNTGINMLSMMVPVSDASLYFVLNRSRDISLGLGTSVSVLQIDLVHITAMLSYIKQQISKNKSPFQNFRSYLI